MRYTHLNGEELSGTEPTLKTRSATEVADVWLAVIKRNDCRRLATERCAMSRFFAFLFTTLLRCCVV